MRVQKWILLFEDVLALFPIFDITSYDFSNYSATLHVVPGYGAAYRAANVWKDFQTIVEDATDGEPIEKPKLSLSASPSGGEVAAGTKVYLTAM